MMRKYLLVAAATLGVSVSAASAADLPMRSSAPAPVMAAPIFTWTGFYLGGSVGYGWGREHRQKYRGGQVTYGSDGGLVGAYVGYNWRIKSLLFGLEVNGDLMRISGDDGGDGGYLDRTTLKGGGALRARVGLLVTPKLNIYGAAGWATARASHFNEGAVNGTTFSRTISGWTAGGGLEYKLFGNWSSRLEYRYTDYGYFKKIDPNDTIADYRVGSRIHDVRLGLTYHFDGPAGGVVAKY